MKVLFLTAMLFLVGIAAKADVLIVYSQLNNGNCRISVQHAPTGSNHYTVVSYVDTPGPCFRKPGVYNAIISVDPLSDLGKAILKADPRANLKNVRAVNEEGLKQLMARAVNKAAPIKAQ